MNMGQFLILELGDYDYHGITTNNWPHPRGNTAVVNSIRKIIPSALSPLPWYYRGYRGNPVISITVQLTGVNTNTVLEHNYIDRTTDQPAPACHRSNHTTGCVYDWWHMMGSD